MSDFRNIVCPHCHTVNRLPAAADALRGHCGRCKQGLFTGQPVELDASSYHRHIRNSEIPVVVDFWAPWCGPCKMMAPAFARAAASLEPDYQLAKLNTENAQAIAAEMGIRSIPTLAVFQKGKEIARMSGAMDANGLINWIRSQNAA